MKPIFADPDLTRVSFARNLLEEAGIPCFIQNENTRTLGPSVAGYSYKNTLDPRFACWTIRRRRRRQS